MVKGVCLRDISICIYTYALFPHFGSYRVGTKKGLGQKGHDRRSGGQAQRSQRGWLSVSLVVRSAAKVQVPLQLLFIFMLPRAAISL